MASKNDEKIQWKRFFQLISGVHYDAPEEVVEEKLLAASKELQDGILGYKKSDPKSMEKLEKEMKNAGQEKIISFAQKLYQFLDLDAMQSWDILKYYLVVEYKGSASSLSSYISSESTMVKLLGDIWFYYSLERMVMLKVVKHILEFYQFNKNPYSGAYKKVLDKIGIANLRKSYIDQFEFLVKDLHPVRPYQGDLFNSQQKMQSWSERKCREMVEILQIILLTCYYDQVKSEELKKLLELFKSHSFGKQHQFLNPSSEFHVDLMKKITYSEIAILLVALNTKDQQDVDWMNEVINSLDNQVITMHQHPEHGPILFVYMLLNFYAKQGSLTDEQTIRLHQIGSRSIQLQTFDFLHKLLCHKMFKDKSIVTKIVRKSIYDHLSYLCELFDADGGIAQHFKVFELFSELLTTPSIALEFAKNEDAPLRSLFASTQEMFPLKFQPFSMVAQALVVASPSGYRFIREQMENLPIYTEIYNGDKYNLSQGDDDEFVLLNDYQPFGRIGTTIKKGTKVVVVDKKETWVHFRTSLNYFEALHFEINELLDNIQNCPGAINLEQIERIECGIRFLGAIIKRIQDPNVEISEQMIHPTEMVFDILGKLKVMEQPPLELFSACLEVCAALLQFPLYNEEIFRRVINLNILPTICNPNLDYMAYANGAGYESGLVGYYLINIERNSGKYSFLKSYFQFLESFIENHSTTSIFSVELPGLIFLLREILPHAHSWHYDSEQDKFDVFIFILQHIFKNLQCEGPRSLLRDVCVYSLLSLENGITLARFVSIGNPALHSFMENETNWVAAAGSNLNLIVQLSMTILMLVLRLKTTLFPESEMSELTPLEQLIYTQPKQRDTLRIIPYVTNYTNYAFNSRLPLLSCRLLKRFALEFKRSLSACLDMEADQIRLTFLQRLRDDLESNDLKIAILEFVDACIKTQPGLTEAFFKVSYENEKKFFIKPAKSQQKSIGEGIVIYMEEYLVAVASDPSKIINPQLSRIMGLFHSLWKNNMQGLVKDLLEKPTFWSSLCNPLLNVGEQLTKVRAYSQLFNILGLELFKLNKNTNEKMNENLKTVMDRFLEPENFEKWIKYVFDFPHEKPSPHETPEWLNNLQSFKDFNVILIKKIDFIQVPDRTKRILIDHCLDALVERAEVTEDLRPFVVMSELFLVVLNDFKEETGDSKMLEKVEILLNMVTNLYENLHKRGKDAVLAIAIRVLDLDYNILVDHKELAERYVRSIVEILGQEIFKLENQVKSGKDMEKEDKNFSIILTINLLKKVLLIFDNKNASCGWEFCFNTTKIFNRLLSVVSCICTIHSKKEITSELFDLLILFSKGDFSKELLYCDIGYYLWLKLLPPKELLERPYVQPNAENQWQSTEWWTIYMKGVELVTTLLEQHKHLFFKDALFFVGIHEEFLLDSLLLVKQSLEKNAIKLIKMTLRFFCELVNYPKEWQMEHTHSLNNTIRCIQILMDQSISLLYRPKILKRLTEVSTVQLDEFDQSGSDVTDDLVITMNQLIEIVTLCTKCLLKFSPGLLNLLCDIEFQQNKYFPLIEIHFGAPKMNSDTLPQLSFGSVLSVICLFTKSLNLQQYLFHQQPMNILPQEDQDWDETHPSTSPSDSSQKATGLTPPTTQSSTPLAESPRRPFTKSISFSSVNGSIVQLPPSNELLSHLDGKTCVIALEFVLTLLASQSLLAQKDIHLSLREKQLIRRELSTELHVFHDFVKKKILKDSTKSILHRKKLGIFKITNDLDDAPDTPRVVKQSAPRKSLEHAKSMRVDVVRKQHLIHQKEKPRNPFEDSMPLSPIPQSKSGEQTPLRGILKPQASTSYKRVGFNLEEQESPFSKVSLREEDEPILLEPIDPSYTGLSLVKLVEEDYLHFLSNLFLVICNTEN